jgi:hypothetical protein
MPRDRDDKKRSRFQYERRSKEDVKEQANQRSGSFDSYVSEKVKMYKARDGKNLIRILPPTWDDAKFYSHEIWVNYGIGADQQTYLSLSKMKGERDPLEEARREAESDGEKKVADALAPKKRKGMWVIDRYAEEEGPLFWAAPFTFDKDLANLCVDEDTGELLYLDDPEEGHDVRFYKEGTGRNTGYPASRMKIMKSTPLSDDQDTMDEWLAYITENPIPDILQYYDYEHIKAVFGGVTRQDDDDDDKKGKSRRGRDKDDDDEKPARRTRVRGTKDEDDDDKKSSKRSSRDDDDDKEERRSSRRSSKDDDDEKDDRKSSTRVRGRRDDDEDDKKDKGSSRRRVREEEEEEDKDDRKSSKRSSRDDDDDDDKKSSKRSSRDKDDDEDDRKSSRRSSKDDDDDDDKKSSKRSRSRDDDDEDDRKSSKRSSRDDDDDGDEGKGKSSVKDRLREMRSGKK